MLVKVLIVQARSLKAYLFVSFTIYLFLQSKRASVSE